MEQEPQCSSKEFTRKERTVLVLDTTAFIAKYALQVYSSNMYTVPSVLQEVKDKESRESLELSILINRIVVRNPSQESIEYIKNIARRIGEHVSLSRTDIEVIALAYELSRKYKVIVITDDYTMQNVLLHLGIPYKPLRTQGIKVARKYKVYCPTCYYVSTNYEEYCPICNTKLRKRPI